MKRNPNKLDPNKAYNKISTYFKINLPLVVIIAIAGLLFDGLMWVIPPFLGKITDAFKNNEPSQSIVNMGLIFILLVLFIQTNRFMKRYFIRFFANRLTLTMRQVSFNYLLHADMSFFGSKTKGDILNRNLSDIYDASEGIRKIFTEFFDSFVLLLGYIGYMAYMDLPLSLITLLLVVISIVGAEAIKKPVYKSVKEYKKALSNSKDTTLTVLNNQVNYKGVGVSSLYYKSYEEEQDLLQKKAEKAQVLKSSLEPLYKMIILIGLVFIFYSLGEKVTTNVWTIGQFQAFLSTFMLVAIKGSRIGKIANSFQGLHVAWERCSSFLNLYTPKTDSLEFDHSGLKVNKASIGYDNNILIDNLSFEAKKGELIFVIGKVHSGKSSLLNVLNGLYSYSGNILLNGVEVKDIRSHQINTLSYCASKVELFSSSLEDNITLYNNEGNLQKALESSCLQEDIQNQSLSLNQVISHSNPNLSGGQQKRVMLARALYPHSEMILLDNPFDSLDEEMSIRIVANLKKNYSSSIIVASSNQPDVFSLGDKILFLDDEIKFDTYQNLLKDASFIKFIKGDQHE